MFAWAAISFVLMLFTGKPIADKNIEVPPEVNMFEINEITYII